MASNAPSTTPPTTKRASEPSSSEPTSTSSEVETTVTVTGERNGAREFVSEVGCPNLKNPNEERRVESTTESRLVLEENSTMTSVVSNQNQTSSLGYRKMPSWAKPYNATRPILLMPRMRPDGTIQMFYPFVVLEDVKMSWIHSNYSQPTSEESKKSTKNQLKTSQESMSTNTKENTTELPITVIGDRKTSTKSISSPSTPTKMKDIPSLTTTTNSYKSVISNQPKSVSTDFVPSSPKSVPSNKGRKLLDITINHNLPSKTSKKLDNSYAKIFQHRDKGKSVYETKIRHS